GHGAVVRALTLVANERSIPVVQADAGVRSHDPRDPLDRSRRAADHACSLWLAATAQQALNLKREGFPDVDVITTGSLLAAALSAVAAPAMGARDGGPRAVLLCLGNASGSDRVSSEGSNL